MSILCNFVKDFKEFPTNTGKFLKVILVCLVFGCVCSFPTILYVKYSIKKNQESYPSFITNTKVQEIYKQKLDAMRIRNDIKSVIVPLIFEEYRSGIFAINYRSIGGKDNINNSKKKVGYLASPKPSLELTKCPEIYDSILDDGLHGYKYRKNAIENLPHQCKQFFSFLFSLAPSTSEYITIYSFKHKIHSNIVIATAFIGNMDVYNLYLEKEKIQDVGKWLYFLNNGYDLIELSPLHLYSKLK